MSELGLGTPVHITNQFDRLFFDETGSITKITQHLQDDGSISYDYYIQVPRIAHGRYFRREEFELVGEQREAEEGKPNNLVTIGGEPGSIVWDFSSGVPTQSITVHVELDGKKIAQQVMVNPCVIRAK